MRGREILTQEGEREKEREREREMKGGREQNDGGCRREQLSWLLKKLFMTIMQSTLRPCTPIQIMVSRRPQNVLKIPKRLTGCDRIRQLTDWLEFEGRYRFESVTDC
jgi:hypothetical protein